jgi:N6-adenosine-specific RNA methylase IME4
MKYNTIQIDPPWALTMTGSRKGKHVVKPALPYGTMNLEQIKDLPVGELAEEGCHLYLWVTNQYFAQGFEFIKHWGFTYLAPIHWVKPSGMGNYWIHRTETMLFAYKKRCIFPLKRYQPNVIFSDRKRHSQKPEAAYELIESVSPGPRLEMFARQRRAGWDAFGNEVEGSISI